MTNKMSDWADIIHQQGEEQLQREEAEIKAMEDGLNDLFLTIENMTNEQLIDYFRDLPWLTHDPRKLVIWDKVQKHTRAVILGRMLPSTSQENDK